MDDMSFKRAVDLESQDFYDALTYTEEAIAGMHEQGRTHDDQYENILLGKLAEIGFKRFCAAHGVKVFVDVGIYEGQDGIDNGDIYDEHERHLDLDVKGVKPTAKNLLLKTCEAHPSTYYVVVRVWGDAKRVQVIGWTTRKYATKNVLCEGDLIPGTNTPIRIENYVTPLKELCWENDDLQILLDKIRNGEIIKNGDDNNGDD